MKIKDNDFKTYFNRVDFKYPFTGYLNPTDREQITFEPNKREVKNDVISLYESMGKKSPTHITWMTLDGVKEEFFDDNLEIITTFGNINWTYFYDTFLDFAVNEIKDVNKEMVKIYEDKLSQVELLESIMWRIFGFIELEDELILIEKSKSIFKLNKEGKLDNKMAPTIEIGDFKEYFLDGDNVTPKAWSKRLRIALVDSDDNLFKDTYLTSDIINEIQKEIKKIDGDDVSKINEPMIFVFYLDREMLNQPEIRNGFAESVNTVFEQKHFNAIAFFLPTDTEERIECVNPKLIDSEEYEVVKDTLETCQKLFDMETKKLD